jgi:hypothetical protein
MPCGNKAVTAIWLIQNQFHGIAEPRHGYRSLTEHSPTPGLLPSQPGPMQQRGENITQSPQGCAGSCAAKPVSLPGACRLQSICILYNEYNGLVH